MNRLISLTSFGLLLVTVMAVPARGTAAERRFRSRGTAAFVSPTGDFVGAGNATHLGNYTEAGNASISPVGEVNATATYTAANGDQLFASITGQIDPFGAITATVTYTGGTGRFANASGSATLTGQIQPDGSLVVAVQGIIDY